MADRALAVPCDFPSPRAAGAVEPAEAEAQGKPDAAPFAAQSYGVPAEQSLAQETNERQETCVQQAWPAELQVELLQPE